MEIDDIKLSNCNKESWTRGFTSYMEKLPSSKRKDDYIKISLSNKINLDELQPFHIVLLACFIEYIHSKGYKVLIWSSNKLIHSYFYEELKIREYFEGGQKYIRSKKDSILNLWKVVDNKAISYSIEVTKYLNNKYFDNYDMSKLKVALDEVYGNIADHSKSNGNAFSYIKYIPEMGKIYVAICDFGLGIARTLRQSYQHFSSDKEALQNSIKIKVSAKTKSHNMGYGLNSLMSTLSENDTLRIVSNKGILNSTGGTKDIIINDLNFEFKGTLIYFDISTNSFPLKEFEDEIVIC